MRRLALLALTAVLTAAIAAAPASASVRVPVTGQYTATIDFTTVSLTPVGRNCQLSVAGTLTFTGSLAGSATGSTDALVLAPCGDVAVSPPGTFADLFRSDLAFTGTADGAPVSADITYSGRTQVGGHVSGLMILGGDLRGVLQVDATVAVGGSYEGFVTHAHR
jgi:hypothetical protein